MRRTEVPTPMRFRAHFVFKTSFNPVKFILQKNGWIDCFVSLQPTSESHYANNLSVYQFFGTTRYNMCVLLCFHSIEKIDVPDKHEVAICGIEPPFLGSCAPTS